MKLEGRCVFFFWGSKWLIIFTHEQGGSLWFTDLTVPVQGALGALFPTLVAVTYFINLQISFKGIEKQKGMMGTLMKFYKWWLEAATIPAFIFGFYLPQGVFMYWLTNNCCSLAQVNCTSW
jgi:membrane protein insertase Oxa1/YidC/SpoIIIJ